MNPDVSYVLYVGGFVLIFLLTYQYAFFMIKKTGQMMAHSFVAATLNVVLGACAVLGWTIYSYGTVETLFMTGLRLGSFLTVLSILVLSVLLFIKRKQFLQTT
ncbi:hypothetical protein ACFFGV_08010 [Pontibacillus salicampi]|uniref:Uncharacterized protein n=1 Tax=Pontibacillus salicampi TaxID=1449801 RepID=A0ABV6LMN9_9BACI